MSSNITGSVQSLVQSSSSQTQQANPNSSLGKDAFLQILVTQLQNQDPSQPLKSNDFIAQMAQFTSVEQLTNMAQQMKLLQQQSGLNPALIGKQVAWSTTDSSGNAVTKNGVVDSISLQSGTTVIHVQGQAIPLSQVTQIANPGTLP